MATAAAGVSDAQLRQGYALLRTPRWPDTFDAAMADDLCRLLIVGAALRLQRGTWHAKPSLPHQRAARARLQQQARQGARFDPKRAAANDLE